MSEKSLDDFFAKKDKGKKGKKNKAKFTTTDEIAKNLTSGEESRKTQKKADKDKKNDDKAGDAMQSAILGTDPAEEWKEEDTKEVDYSDLKIQSLQVSEEALKAESEEAEEEELDEFGEPIRSKSQVSSGPWKTATEPEVKAPASDTVVTEPKEEPANVKAGVYVPPSRRNAPASTPDRGVQKSRLRGKKKAPEINCEQEFPTLAASADILKHSDKRDERTFETVTRGGPKMDGSTSRGPGLQLDNRYSALERN